MVKEKEAIESTFHTLSETDNERDDYNYDDEFIDDESINSDIYHYHMLLHQQRNEDEESQYTDIHTLAALDDRTTEDTENTAMYIYILMNHEES